MANSPIPDIRTFQIDASKVGILKNSVNLFRGDVTYSQNLFTLPGRSDNDGLALDFSIQYQSNVHQAVFDWNRDAPTGILGVGWSLAQPVIRADPRGSVLPDDWQFSLTMQGAAQALIREPVNPWLLALDAGLLACLPVGTALAAPNLLAALRGNGFAVDGGASVTAIVAPWPVADPAARFWCLHDAALQQEFYLALEQGQLGLYDGGWSFQLANYNFWKIIYYPGFERWKINNSAGLVSIYGGGVCAADGRGVTLVNGVWRAADGSCPNLASEGNGIEWGVLWCDGHGIPAWLGSSTAAVPQQAQFARAWHLVRSYSRFGEYVRFEYNGDPAHFARGADGLLAGVEQAVAAGGKPYTKACYLTGACDVFGRCVRLGYLPKLWQDQAHEYADPHKGGPLPDTRPNGFQDSYEAHYLAHMVVQDSDGSTLFSLRFDYDAAGGTGVVDVAGGGADTAKRYLTGLALVNGDGVALPGFAFDYYWAATDPHPGALRSIVWPSGGVVSYQYQAAQLDCQRTLDLPPPAPLPGDALPRVWFGPGYAVVLWWHLSAQQLGLQMVSWDGQWQPWPTEPGSCLLLSDLPVQPDSLNVITGSDVVGISYVAGEQTCLHLFAQNKAQPNLWHALSSGTASPASPANPSPPGQSWPLADGPLSFYGGDNFLLALQQNSANPSLGGYWRYTWHWPSASWQCEAVEQNIASLCISGNGYLSLDFAARLTRFWQDSFVGWQASAPLPLFATVGGTQPLPVFAPQMAAGESWVALVNDVGSSALVVDYYLTLVAWNRAHQLTQVFGLEYIDSIGDAPPSRQPLVSGPGMLMVAGHVLRFDGQVWQQNDALVATGFQQAGDQQRYAAGPDYALEFAVTGNGSNASGSMVAWDATAGNWGSGSPPFAMQTLNPGALPENANWPSAGGSDYFVMGSQLYFRGSQTDASQITEAVADLQALLDDLEPGRYALNTLALLDQSPDFLVCPASDAQTGNGSVVVVALLHNGSVRTPLQILPGNLHLPNDGDAGAGLFAGGVSAFVTSPGSQSSFDAGGPITLHYYCGRAVQGPIDCWPVVQVTIDDGFGQTPSQSHYQPALDSARCDASGTVAKFYQSRVYPAGSATDPAHGWLDVQYQNGNQVASDNYYRCMDGLLSSIACYRADGQLLSRLERTWQAFVARAADPLNPGPVRRLCGAFVVPDSVTLLRDGVGVTRSNEYRQPGFAVPWSNQLVRQSTASMGGNGQPRNQCQTMVRACEQYPASRAHNDLGSRVGQMVQVNGITTNASLTVLTGSDAVGDVRVLAEALDLYWQGGADGSVNPLAGYFAGNWPPPDAASGLQLGAPAGWLPPTPSDWLPDLQILARASNGNLTLQQDASGTLQATLYGTKSGLPYAVIKGARAEQCALTFFWEDEAGSEMPGSEMPGSEMPGSEMPGSEMPGSEMPGNRQASGAQIDPALAWFGQNSLCLPTGGQFSMTAEPGDGVYRLTLRYCVESGSDASWQLVQGGSVLASGTLDGPTGSTGNPGSPGSPGPWQTLSLLQAVAPAGAPLALQISQSGSNRLWLDSIMLLPASADVTLTSWYVSVRRLRASMNASGNASFTLYDRFWRSQGSVGPDGQLQELAVSAVARQFDASGAAGEALPQPNAELTASFAAGGHAETFRSASQWQQRWQPGNPALWQAVDGTLQKQADSADTLRWVGPTPACQTSLFFLELVWPVPPATVPDRLECRFGPNRIGYLPDSANDGGGKWYWQDADGKPLQAALARRGSMARQWLLLLHGQRVWFFADGQLLFCAAGQIADLADFSFASGNNPILLARLMAGFDARLGISYTDGAARQRQVHQLHGADSLLAELVYDGLDQQIAQTRVAPCASAGSAAPLAYRETFVDVPAFLAAQGDTCLMQGELAEYYRGQPEGRFNRSDDQGYPYHGVRYEASVQKRQTESGAPGLPQAIHDVDRIPFDERNTLRMVYGTDPSGQFPQQTTITPGAAVGRLVFDPMQRTLASSVAAAPDPAAIAGQTRVDSVQNSQGVSLDLWLPNALAAAQWGTPDPLALRHIEQNMQGQIARFTDPDCGTTQLLHNGKGLLRFAQIPLEAGETGFAYQRYDRLGRKLEDGWLNAPWDPAQLATRLEQTGYPAAADGAQPARRFDYDGQGGAPGSPNNIGQLTRVTTFNPAPKCLPAAVAATVQQDFVYDAQGRVAVASQQISGPLEHSVSASYRYNNLNQITRIEFSAELNLPALNYLYDDQGHTVAIRDDGGHDLVAYQWSADGQLLSCQRGPLLEDWTYDSCNNLLTHAVDVADPGPTRQTVFRQDYGYNPDRQITARTTRVAFGTAAATQTGVQYGYDAAQRLQSALVTGGAGNLLLQDQDGAPGIDPNGNIRFWQRDGQAGYATLAPGSNRISASSLPGGFHYRQDGRADLWRGMTLEYDPVLGSANAVLAGSTTRRYVRGMGNQLVLWQGENGSRIEFHGAGHVPALIWNGPELQLCVWGVNGLEAVYDGAWHYPLSDHQGTVWAVTDAGGACQARFDYDPFGQMLIDPGQAQASLPGWCFHFGGKPYDSALGLYDFAARLYDPQLMRFPAPDAAYQFASPYVFSSNSPLNMIDPSGHVSIWSRIVIGLETTLVLLSGVLLAVVTDGVGAAAEAGLLSGEGLGEGGGVAGAAGGEAAGAGEAGSVGAASTETGEEGSALKKVGQKVWEASKNIPNKILAGAAIGAGFSGLSYDASHGRDFTTNGFLKAIGVGAASWAVNFVTGDIAGEVFGALGPDAKGLKGVKKLGYNLAKGVASGVIGNDVSTLVADGISGSKITLLDMGESAFCGLVFGAISGGIESVGEFKSGGISQAQTLLANTLVLIAQLPSYNFQLKEIFPLISGAMYLVQALNAPNRSRSPSGSSSQPH